MDSRRSATGASGLTNESRAGPPGAGRTSTAWLDTNTALWDGGPLATQAGADPREQLERALDNMAANSTGPAGLFAGKFRVTKERRSGAQALVQFARGGDDGFFQHAIKFYYVKRDYDIEMRLLARRAELPCVPQVFAASDNADGALRSPSGWPFPPYVVMERGATLREWLQASLCSTVYCIAAMRAIISLTFAFLGHFSTACVSVAEYARCAHCMLFSCTSDHGVALADAKGVPRGAAHDARPGHAARHPAWRRIHPS